MSELVFVVPGDLDTPTGGYRYDRAIVHGLRERGMAVEVMSLEGGYPLPSDAHRAAAIDRLAGLPRGGRVVIDGLALGALPEIAQGATAHLQAVGLVHHPLADETGLPPRLRERFLAQERLIYPVCDRIIVTSRFTAKRLRQGFGLTPSTVHIVEPGTEPAPLAAGCGSPLRLLSVGSLIPRKGHDVLLRALAPLTGLDWHLDIVGGGQADPRAAHALHALSRDLGLDDKVTFAGACDSATLAQHYHRADVFVLASHYEGYGMVFAEALARGLPIVATTGGAIASTVPASAGLLVPPGDIDALRLALKRMLDDAPLRADFRQGALEARQRLTAWPEAVGAFVRALEGASPHE